MSAITSSGAYVGTDKLGRALTDEEKELLGKLLREQGFAGAMLLALRFAHKLARGREAAKDLLGRTNLRFVRWGWDPAEVPLARRLCRLVWSEFTHQKRETEAAKRAEEGFLREQTATEGLVVLAAPSTEERAIRLEQDREDDVRGEAGLALLRVRLAELRAHFEKEKDEVNLLFMAFVEKEVTDPATMARDSGRDVTEFYAAAKRRKRIVEKLLAAKSGAPGTNDEESE